MSRNGAARWLADNRSQDHRTVHARSPLPAVPQQLPPEAVRDLTALRTPPPAAPTRCDTPELLRALLLSVGLGADRKQEFFKHLFEQLKPKPPKPEPEPKPKKRVVPPRAPVVATGPAPTIAQFWAASGANPKLDVSWEQYRGFCAKRGGAPAMSCEEFAQAWRDERALRERGASERKELRRAERERREAELEEVKSKGESR